MPWSLADFSSKLMVGISGDGARVVYAPTGLADIKNDGSWFYSVGSGNVASGYTDPLGTSSYPNGFDGYKYTDGNYQNLAVNLFPFANTLYGGMICQYVPEYDIPPDINDLKGSQIWKSSDGLTWTQITNDGFGDTNIINFEAFTGFAGRLYVSGSKGASSTPEGLGGAKIFRLASIPTLIELSSFEAKGLWRKIYLTWKTESEIGNTGFNIYRADAEDGEYTKLNNEIIAAKGSDTAGAVYSFVDRGIERGKTYYYKLEDVDMSGITTLHGPVSATAKSLYMMMFGR